ncbi:MAG: hypothetical protein C4341_00990 [Armatimonadota bacterium]
MNNGLWLGLKPAVQFLAGAVLLRQNPALAAEFYTLLLLWTAGYEACSLLADRQLVVLANQAKRMPLVAFRSLLPLLVAAGAALAVLCGGIGSSLTEATILTAIGMCALGAVAGISEAGFWAAAAEVGAFRTLAGVRLLSTGAFFALLIAAARGVGSVALALAAETAIVTLVFAALHGWEVSSAKPVRLPAVRIFGFYLVKGVSYLNRFVESWWAVGTLSGIALAAFRVGLAPKSFLMMAFTALVQPTLFRVSASDWRERRDEARKEVVQTADLLIVLASGTVVFTSAATLLLPALLKPYRDALGVAWVSLAFFCGPGWFGMLASSLLTNWGAIRLPILATVGGVLMRSGVYGLLVLGDRLTLLSMALVAEAVTAAAQNAFWRRVLAAEIWTVDCRVVYRVLGRSCLTLGSLLFWLTTAGALPLIVLCVTHTLVAVDAAAEARAATQSSRRTPRTERTRSRSSSE